VFLLGFVHSSRQKDFTEENQAAGKPKLPGSGGGDRGNTPPTQNSLCARGSSFAFACLRSKPAFP